MKTYYVFDTNSIKIASKYTDFNSFSVNKRLVNLRKKIEKSDLIEKYGIIIPVIVLEELKMQQISNFKIEYQKLKQSYRKFESLNFIDVNKVEEINYGEMIEKWSNEFIRLNDIEVLEICPEEKFNKIVSRALTKKAPFKGGDGESDKGFKDVLIWESLLSFSQKNKGNYIFVTSDNDFKEILQTEFLEETGNTISFRNISGFENNVNELDKEINDLSQVKKLENLKEELKYIKEDLIEQIKDVCFKNVNVFGNTFINPTIEFENMGIIGGGLDSVYKLSIKYKVILEDIGVHYELNLEMVFEVVYDEYIEEIKLTEVIAKQLNGRIVEDFMIEDFVKSYESPIEDVEQDLIQDLIQDLELSTEENLSETEREKEAIYKVNVLDANKIEKILHEFTEEIKTQKEEIINVIEKSASLDWYAFSNKESLIKTELKKLFRKNSENKQVISSLVDEIINYAKKTYEEYNFNGY